jgi:hypothetical protein
MFAGLSSGCAFPIAPTIPAYDSGHSYFTDSAK